MAEANPFVPTGTPKKKIPVASNVDYIADDPFELGYSPADIERQQKEGNTRAGIVAGIGAVGRLGQLGLSAIDTAADKENKSRLAALAKHKGLDQGELSELNHALMDPVRSLASENRARAEGIAAGSGQNSVATLNRIQRTNESETNRAALQAGIEVSRANREQINRDKQEEQERISYNATRARDRLNMIGATLGGLSRELGPVIAAGAVRTEPSDASLIAMRDAKTADGAPVYPGLQGMNDAQLRQAHRNQRNHGTAAPVAGS